jgi:hypothetical protein
MKKKSAKSAEHRLLPAACSNSALPAQNSLNSDCF